MKIPWLVEKAVLEVLLLAFVLVDAVRTRLGYSSMFDLGGHDEFDEEIEEFDASATDEVVIEYSVEPTETTVQRCPSCGAIAVKGSHFGYDDDRPVCPRDPCLVDTFRPTRWNDEEEIYAELEEIENVDPEVAEIPIHAQESETA